MLEINWGDKTLITNYVMGHSGSGIKEIMRLYVLVRFAPRFKTMLCIYTFVLVIAHESESFHYDH